MYISRMKSSEVDPDRLDPYYYSPKFLQLIRAISINFSKTYRIGDLFKVLDGTHDSVVTQDKKAREFSIPFLRSQDIGSGLLKRYDGAFLRKNDHEVKCKRSKIFHGDVLLNIMASTGEACVYERHNPEEANANRAVGILRPKKGTSISLNEKRFLAILLSSNLGGQLLSRSLKGSIQQRLNLSDIESCSLPSISSTVAVYIGNKVRQAEALRARARESERLFAAEVECEVPYIHRRGRFSRVAPGMLNDDLNPGRFDPDRLAVREAILHSGGVQLNSFASISAQTVSPNSSEQAYLGLDGIDSNTIDLSFQSVEEAGASGTSRLLLPGPVISKLRPYLNKVAYVPQDKVGSIGSTELLCVVPEGVHPAYVYGVLKLSSSLRQLNPVATGATHPRIATDDVLELVVPMHDEHERLGTSLEFAQYGYSAARALTNASKALVEALIERKVTEAELIAANNDPSADRELMQKLTVDGFDVSGAAPLFDDLDRLQELLNEANSAGGSDEV